MNGEDDLEAQFEELAEDYRPKGACSQCEHPATEIHFLYRGERRYDFRCSCCVAKAKLERALEYQKRIPKLQAALAEAEAACGGTETG